MRFWAKTNLFIFFFVLLVFGTIDNEKIAANGETIKKITIDAVIDSSVDEDLPKQNFANKDLLAIGWTHNSSKDDNTVKQALSYIKFSLDKIPESSKYETISIKTIKLNMWIEEGWWNENDKHSLTISSCFDNSWTEENITWNTRPCKDLENGLRYSLEKSYIQKQKSFDVTDIIVDANDQNLSEITFALSSCSTGKGRIDCQKNPGLVWVQSLENKDQGINQTPQLEVQYIIEKKSLNLQIGIWEIVIIGIIIVSTFLVVQYFRKDIPFRRFKEIPEF